jgi:DNA-directed RNA polymerase subunit omega
MIHPSYSELMHVVNSEAEADEEPIVSSRYSIVLATSKRARQLIAGEESLLEDDEYVVDKPLSTAVKELYTGKVKILPYVEEEERQDEEEEETAEIQ